MNIRKVTSDVVRVPELIGVDMARMLTDPDRVCQFREHVLYLTPREWEGRIVTAAYLRENDTLYIHEPD